MKRKILIVDDSATMRDMLSFTLETAGFAVTEVGDGEAALEVLRDRGFDLVITDINMPRLDGIELTRKVRQMEHLAFMPVLCLTTETSEEKKLAARSAGATGWLTKPFDPDTLVQTVSRVCL